MLKEGFDHEFTKIAVVGIHDLHVNDSDKHTKQPMKLQADRQRWLLENIKRGCDDAQIKAAMVSSGFESALLESLLVVARAYVNRPHALTGVVGDPNNHHSDPIRLRAGNQICIDGQVISVSSVMHDPCIAVLDNVISDAECGALIERSTGKLNRSSVVDNKNGGSVVSQVRTSEGTHFKRGDGAVITGIEQRLCKLINQNSDNFEPMQILHYKPGGEYKPHDDYFSPSESGNNLQFSKGGNRVATFILYLNDVAKGGETSFPSINFDVRPKRGRAVYFEYMNEANQLDPRCRHAGKPVIEGEKWIATKWLRADRYED